MTKAAPQYRPHPNDRRHVRIVHSPDEGVWYAVKDVLSWRNGELYTWRSRDVYPSEDDLLTALRLGTVQWEKD